MLKELLLKNRSYRRFVQEIKISNSDLEEMVDAARLSASGRNAQSLKYILSNDSTLNNVIFPNLAWAGYLKDWAGPTEGERPSAYIIQLNDKEVSNNYYCDDGIALQSILLTAVEKGYGGCIIASLKKNILSESLNLPENFEILHVIALGKPAEEVVIEEMVDNDIKYWRDENEVHHVPKRKLADIIVDKQNFASLK